METSNYNQSQASQEAHESPDVFTVRFPENESLGSFYLITSAQDGVSWWENKLGDAKGTVEIPRSYAGRLHLIVESFADVSHLVALQNCGLVSLDFRHRPVNDLELSHIQRLKDLKYLSLPQSPITDRGLIYLINLENLQTLDIGGTVWTGEGV